MRCDDFVILQKPLQRFMQVLGIKGTVLLAKEGINGTISGDKNAIDNLLAYLHNEAGFVSLECKFSVSERSPFKRLKVKLKKEIVTLGVANISPKSNADTYVAPIDWNALIKDPDVILIDTRNNYEHEIGTFSGAINPNTESFREFPAYADKYLTPHFDKKIAMFCTGGIRCEKSTIYLKSQGFRAVYHLQGGILKYLAEIDEKNSLWQGECFVFDDRVAVKHNLEIGKYDQCHACRYPITKADKQHPHFEKGVACPRCFGSRNKTQIARYRERQKQMLLAQARGVAHIGDDVSQNKAKR